MLKKLYLIIASLMMAFTLTGCFGPSPEDTAKEYMDAIIADDTERVLATLNLSDNEKIVAKGKFAVIMATAKSNAESHGGFDGYSINDVKIVDNQATMKIKTSYKDGTVEVSDITLVKVEDKWLVEAK